MALAWDGKTEYLLRNGDGAVLLHGAVHKACEALPPRNGVQQKWYRLSLYAFTQVYTTREVRAPAKTSSEGKFRMDVNRVYVWREQYQRTEIDDPKRVLQAMADMKFGAALGMEWAWIGPKQRWPKPAIVWQ